MLQNPRAQSAFLALTLTLSVGGSLYLGEWVLRSFYHFPNSLAPNTPFRNTLPGSHFHLTQKEFEIDLDYNRQGFRDEDFENNLDATKKLLFLGDSFIEGFGVEEHQRASDRVKTALKKIYKGKSIAVFNAGQVMSGPFHYFKNLINFGIGLKPDGVVVGLFMGNDFIGGRHHPVPNGYLIAENYPASNFVGEGEGFLELAFLRTMVYSVLKGKKPLQPRLNSDQYWKYFYGKKIDREFFFENSGMTRQAFDNHLNTLPENIRQNFLMGRVNPSYLTSSFFSASESTGPAYTADDIRNVFDLLYEMYFICSQRNIHFLIVIFPSPYQVFPEEYTAHLKKDLGYKKVPNSLKELKRIHQSLVDWLTLEGIETLDMLPLLKQQDYFLFDGHLKPSGQSNTASKILDKIQPWINRSTYQRSSR